MSWKKMQRNKESYYIQRVLLYTGRFIRGQLKAGDKYEDLKDVIMINILNFDLFKEINEIHTIWRLREENHPELGTLEGLEVHFIELEKFRNSNPNFNEKINQWLALIDTENEKWQMDYDSAISYATKKGHADGLAEGELNTRIAIAKKLLKKNSDLQEIIEITGLAKYEILKLKK